MALGIRINGHMQQGKDALNFSFPHAGKVELAWISRSALDLLPHDEQDSGEMIFEKNLERIEEIISARIAAGRTDFDISTNDLM